MNLFFKLVLYTYNFVTTHYCHLPRTRITQLIYIYM